MKPTYLLLLSAFAVLGLAQAVQANTANVSTAVTCPAAKDLSIKFINFDKDGNSYYRVANYNLWLNPGDDIYPNVIFEGGFYTKENVVYLGGKDHVTFVGQEGNSCFYELKNFTSDQDPKKVISFEVNKRSSK